MNKNKIKPQELLTGKAKEAFDIYLFNSTEYLYSEITTLDGRTILPLIIEWLDSVGIYVETFVLSQDREIGFCFNISVDEIFEDGMWYNTRHQATQEAIKNSVEIFNKGAI